jgi:hypothetical protein
MTSEKSRRWLSGICGGLLAVPAVGQSFLEVTEVRRPVRPYLSLFQVEAGVIGTVAGTEVPAVGLEDGFGWDGHVYYHDDNLVDRRGSFTGYAGRDGLCASLADGDLVGDQTTSRLEIRARPWQFYRDGFYRGSAFVPNGIYTSEDYEGYLAFGRELAPGLYGELGGYYRDYSFEATDLTPGFQIPADYAAYGARLHLEQNTTELDRRRGLPRAGGLAALVVEQEWNDSEGEFGVAGFTSELPSQVWRARGRYDFYAPASEDTVWEFSLRGAWSDRTDRVQNFEAQRPLGHQWADGALRLRIHFGDAWIVTPFVQGQWSRVAGESGGSSSNEFFFGGGVESWLHLNDAFSLHGWYSFLDNESRPSIETGDDVHGEHMFYLGVVMRFGSQRR